MLVYQIDSIKNFMALLFKSNTFDAFEVRNVLVTTFTSFEIHGNYNSTYFLNENQAPAAEEKRFCTWQTIRPYAFEIIKGTSLPSLIKIVFSADATTLAAVSDKAASCFLNLLFENGKLLLTSGFSLKTFSMDKAPEQKWDTYIEQFLKQNGINVSTQSN